MQVHVIRDAGARHAAQVGADVEAIRVQRGAQSAERSAERAQQGEPVLGVEIFERGNVRVRSDHQVAAVVREAVHDHEGTIGTAQDQGGTVRGLGLVAQPAEQAAGLLLATDVLHPPGRVEMLH